MSLQTFITKKTTFRFGKYQGRVASEVARFDPTYIFYLASKDEMHIDLELLTIAYYHK